MWRVVVCDPHRKGPNSHRGDPASMLRSKTRYVTAKVSLGQFNSKCFGPLCQYHSTEAPYLLFNLSPKINNLSNRQRRRITHLQRY